MDLSPDLNELLGLFRSHSVDFVVVGAHALAFHGAPRFTGDIDLLIDRAADNARNVLAALDAFGFGGLGLTATDFAAPDQVIQLGYPPTRVDILTSISGVEWSAVRTAAVEGPLGTNQVRFIGLHELVANKQASGRLKDLADIEAIERLLEPKD